MGRDVAWYIRCMQRIYTCIKMPRIFWIRGIFFVPVGHSELVENFCGALWEKVVEISTFTLHKKGKRHYVSFFRGIRL